MSEKLFFELLQVALGHRESLSHTPTLEEWKDVVDVAKRQSLVGICFLGVQKLNSMKDSSLAHLPATSYVSWAGLTAKIKMRNEVVNRQCVDTQRVLKEGGFRSSVIKGQAVGNLYQLKNRNGKLQDISLFRQSGDIDIWVEGAPEKLIAFVKEVCPEKVDISSKHIEMRLFEDTIVEAHFRPSTSLTICYSQRLQDFYDKYREVAMGHEIELIDGSRIIAPTPLFHAIQVLGHAFGHFLFEGIGLRQMLDYYFVIQQPFTEEEKQEIVETLKRTGMYRYARCVMYVMQEAFGAGESFIPADRKMGARVLKSIMEEGNFGKHDQKRDQQRMNSSLYRFIYHTRRQIQFLPIAPLTILWSPIGRMKEYAWRKRNGYFR